MPPQKSWYLENDSICTSTFGLRHRFSLKSVPSGTRFAVDRCTTIEQMNSPNWFENKAWWKVPVVNKWRMGTIETKFHFTLILAMQFLAKQITDILIHHEHHLFLPSCYLSKLLICSTVDADISETFKNFTHNEGKLSFTIFHALK